MKVCLLLYNKYSSISHVQRQVATKSSSFRTKKRWENLLIKKSEMKSMVLSSPMSSKATPSKSPVDTTRTDSL